MSKQPISKRSTSYLNLNNFNYLSQPIQSIQQIFQKDWQIKSLQISEHGQTGVLFIQTNIGAFVLKMNNQAPIDYFFNILAQQINLSVVNIMVVSCYEQFFQTLCFKIQKFCQKDQILSRRLRKRMDFPFYQLMEYIPGISLLQVGRNRFQKYQIQQSKLQSIGICIGFDMLINNSDRFKLKKIWSQNNQGNISNVLIRVPEHYSHNYSQIKDRQNLSINLGQYCYIDHSGFLLDVQNDKLSEQNYNKYIQKVLEFQQSLIQYFRDQQGFPKQLQNLINQIQLYTKYKLNYQQIMYVIQGIIYSTSKFIQIYEQNKIEQIIQSIYKGNKQQQIQGYEKGKNRKQKQIIYWNQYWNKDVKKIRIKHLQRYYTKVAALYITYDQIVKEVYQHVIKNIGKILGIKKKKSITLSNRSNSINNRPQSKDSINSKNSQQQKKSNNQLQNDLQNQVKENNKEQQDQKQRMGIKITRRKLQEKLQAFKKKNYQNKEY